MIDGTPVTGWKNDIPGWEGSWYYFDPNTGEMATGWKQIDARWYYFDLNTGAMLTNTTTPDGFWVGEDGVLVQ